MATYTPSKVDDAAFTPATDTVVPIGALADETAPDSVNEGDVGIPRMSLNRALNVRIRDDLGNERGMAINAAGEVGVQQGSAASLQATVHGTIAHDTADSTAPHKIGGQARTTNPTAVADADRVNAIFDDLGRQVTVLNQVRDLVTDATTTITSSTTETTILAAAASTFHDLTALVVINTSATAVRVDFRDATAGTIRFALYIPAGDTRGFVLQVPRPQTTVNNNWTAQCSASVADVRIFIQAVKNV